MVTMYVVKRLGINLSVILATLRRIAAGIPDVHLVIVWRYLVNQWRNTPGVSGSAQKWVN